MGDPQLLCQIVCLHFHEKIGGVTCFKRQKLGFNQTSPTNTKIFSIKNGGLTRVSPSTIRCFQRPTTLILSLLHVISTLPDENWKQLLPEAHHLLPGVNPTANHPQITRNGCYCYHPQMVHGIGFPTFDSNSTPDPSREQVYESGVGINVVNPVMNGKLNVG